MIHHKFPWAVFVFWLVILAAGVAGAVVSWRASP